MLFGGTGDRDDLQYWSTLAGERDEPITTTDLHGRVASRTTRRVPVLAPAQIATLPPGRVVVFTSVMPPVIGRAEMAHRRLDVRAHHTPNALTIRARAWAGVAAAGAGAWAVTNAVALLAALVGLWIGAPGGAAAAEAAGKAPGWAGWLSGGFLGVMSGLLAGHLTALAWQRWHAPVLAWVSRWSRPVLAWASIRWARMRTRRAGLRVAAAYQPYSAPRPATAPIPALALARPGTGHDDAAAGSSPARPQPPGSGAVIPFPSTGSAAGRPVPPPRQQGVGQPDAQGRTDDGGGA